LRACISSLGGDQFDNDDPVEQRQKISFFNWFTFAISFGGFLGLIFVVWVENKKGWDIGFALCALLVLIGLIATTCGLPFYRNQIPAGSPLTQILQVQTGRIFHCCWLGTTLYCILLYFVAY
jgi:solute carrier family 15 (peptide/histidine transporter), member 3/4